VGWCGHGAMLQWEALPVNGLEVGRELVNGVVRGANMGVQLRQSSRTDNGDIGHVSMSFWPWDSGQTRQHGHNPLGVSVFVHVLSCPECQNVVVWGLGRCGILWRVPQCQHARM
jgi:hypothetical protein